MRGREEPRVEFLWRDEGYIIPKEKVRLIAGGQEEQHVEATDT